MPNIQAFRGIRYDLGHVGSLSNVIAPPYDVIDSALQQQLYDTHPANVVRLILNKDEPGDDEHDNRYTRAARLMRLWQREGVLFTEADPALYVYHQVFAEGGIEYTRRGFMCRVRLERFGEGNIYPHEETHGAAKADRLKLWNACKANLSQIFGLFPDEENEAQEVLEAAITEAKAGKAARSRLRQYEGPPGQRDGYGRQACRRTCGPKLRTVRDRAQQQVRRGTVLHELLPAQVPAQLRHEPSARRGGHPHRAKLARPDVWCSPTPFRKTLGS